MREGIILKCIQVSRYHNPWRQHPQPPLLPWSIALAPGRRGTFGWGAYVTHNTPDLPCCLIIHQDESCGWAVESVNHNLPSTSAELCGNLAWWRISYINHILLLGVDNSAVTMELASSRQNAEDVNLICPFLWAALRLSFLVVSIKTSMIRVNAWSGNGCMYMW